MLRRLRTHVARVRSEQRTLRALFQEAEAVARADGRDRAGPEDFVLAAVDLPDGEVRRCLAAVGVTREELAAAIASQHGEALGRSAADVDERVPDVPGRRRPAGALRASGAAEDLFRQVAEEIRHERAHVSGGRILAVALEADRGALARACTLLGLDRLALAQLARREAASRASDG